MVISIYMLLPAIEGHVVLTAMIPATTTATTAGASDDVDGAAGGIVDGEIRGRLAVHEDGAGVVEQLVSAVGVAPALLELGVELVEGDHFCEWTVSR